MRQVTVFAAKSIAAVFLCLLASGLVNVSVFGQPSRSISSTGRRIDEINRQAEKVERDEMNRDLRGRPPSREELKQAAAKKEQIKKDFEGLQAEYNKIVLALKAREPLADSFVADAAENIHEHSTGLRHNIVFPENKKQDAATSAIDDDKAVKSLLLKLCLRVHSFITSPMFETPSVLDISAAEKARDDLSGITRISDRLRKAPSKAN